MTNLVVVMVLIGVTLGLRFTVFIFVPVCAALVVVFVLSGVAQHIGVLSVLVEVVLSLNMLTFGYVVGLAINQLRRGPHTGHIQPKY